MDRRVVCTLGWVTLLCFLIPSAAQAQPSTPAAGRFLIADRELGDPNFSETVILLISYSADDGAMGLVVNRRTDVSIARVLRELKEAKGRSDPVYVGGPVEPGGVLALFKTASKPEDAKRVFADVYLISSRDLLQKTLATTSADANLFHVYLGYSGWGPGQLEHEMGLGAWHVLPADVEMVFHSEPETVWPRLIRRTELRIALGLAPTTPAGSLRPFHR